MWELFLIKTICTIKKSFRQFAWQPFFFSKESLYGNVDRFYFSGINSAIDFLLSSVFSKILVWSHCSLRTESGPLLKMQIQLVFLVAIAVVVVQAIPADHPRPNYREIELEALDTEIEDGGKYHYR